MSAGKQKKSPSEQRAQSTARHSVPEVPSIGEGAKEAVFDHDSMFNSADRQSATQPEERAAKAGLHKTKKQTSGGKAA